MEKKPSIFLLESKPNEQDDVDTALNDITSLDRYITNLKTMLAQCRFEVMEGKETGSQIQFTGFSEYNDSSISKNQEEELTFDETTTFYFSKMEPSKKSSVLEEMEDTETIKIINTDITQIDNYLSQAHKILFKLEENKKAILEQAQSKVKKKQASNNHENKEIRTAKQIAVDVRRKLDALKADKNELRALMDRIERYKAESHTNTRIDWQQLSKYDKSEAVELHANQVQARLAAAKLRKSQLAKEKEKNLHNQLKIKEVLYGVGKIDPDMPFAQAKLRLMREKWLILILVGSRMYRLQDCLLSDQKHEYKRIQEQRAAVTIQRFYRSYKARINNKEKNDALTIITRFVVRIRPKIRDMIQKRAANVIVEFFHGYDSMPHLLRAVKLYRRNVIACQRYIRSFLDIKNSQLYLLTKQWKNLEVEWWKRRKEAMQQKLTNNRKTPAFLVTGSHESIVPADIRLKLLIENLESRKKLYRQQLIEYQSRLKEWKELQGRKWNVVKALSQKSSREHRQADRSFTVDGLVMNEKTGHPVMMNFKVLLDEESMYQLIEQGFVMSSSNGSSVSTATATTQQ